MKFHKFLFQEIFGKEEIVEDMKRTASPAFYMKPDDEIKENQDFEYQIVGAGANEESGKRQG